jgi:hypothetical protein
MERLAEEYADLADFFTVWAREPHAGGDFPQPETIEQRAQYARAFQQSDEASIRIILDDMEGSLQELMGGFPNVVYVIDGRGHVVYRANWTDAREIGRVLGRLGLIAERREAGQNLGMGRWSEESMPALHDDPNGQAVNTIRVWEEAKNYDEPERFMGVENAERLRETYERVTGEQSIRPGA